MFNLFGKKRILGVDIGTSSIKLVELIKSKNSFELETFGIAQISYKDSEETQDHSPLNITVSTLKELMKKSKVKTKDIVASLPSSTVFVTVIQVPKAPPKQQKALVEQEAKKIIPLPLKEVTVSWNVIPAMEQEDPRTQSILLTAVPNHVILNYIKVFEKLKLNALAIEVEGVALIRSMIGQDASTVILLDIGAKTSTITLINKGYIYFSRGVNAGSEAITNSISKTLGVDLERAEQFKRSVGILDYTAGSQEVPKSLRPILELLKTEVERLFHMAQTKGHSPEKIVLTGGGAHLMGLTEYLKQFGLPVVVGDPWAQISVPEKVKPMVQDLGPMLSVGVGLAMRHE